VRVPMTEYLEIDLERAVWVCRACDHELVSARDNYKRGTLVYDRDPSTIHRPLIDPNRYEFTFAPDPAWCRILEFYCPNCGTMIETEYLPPGHPPTYDMEIDVDALKRQWSSRSPSTPLTVGPGIPMPTPLPRTRPAAAGPREGGRS
jgi:acetone carboxylase, gamma subunit